MSEEIAIIALEELFDEVVQENRAHLKQAKEYGLRDYDHRTEIPRCICEEHRGRELLGIRNEGKLRLKTITQCISRIRKQMTVNNSSQEDGA